jgi:hypothetical protein
VCESCSSVLSSMSVLSPTEEEDEFVWSCEFCSHKNLALQIDQEEMPVIGSTESEYMLTPAPSSGGGENGVIVFCMDISGSMCVTSEVPSLQAEWKSLRQQKNKEAPPPDQFLPGENRNVEYISRLQCMQTAVITQMDRILVENSQKKVLLITFNNEVHVYSRASEPLHLGGDKLFSEASLHQAVAAFEWETVDTVKDCHEIFNQRIQGLEEGGATALGPALSVAIELCSRQKGSSEVIVCTDGMPNVGVGSLDEGNAEGRAFYSRIAEIAQSNSTVVNVIAIEGCDCSLDDFKSCAEATSGELNTLHPLELVRQLRKISQNPTVATDVEVRLLLHPSLEVGGGIPTLPKKPYQAVIAVGNASKMNDLTFEYSVRSKSRKEELSSLPFQIQIRYKRKDGSQCLRVLSQRREVSRDRMQVEVAMNCAVASLAIIHGTAAEAEKGDFESARLRLHAARKMMERGALTDEQQEEMGNFVSQTEDLERELLRCQKKSEGSKSKSVKTDDESVRLFYQMKKVDGSKLLSAQKKTGVVQNRKGNAALDEQYYSYRFE